MLKHRRRTGRKACGGALLITALTLAALSIVSCQSARPATKAKAIDARVQQAQTLIDQDLIQAARVATDEILSDGEGGLGAWWCDAQVLLRQGHTASAAARCEAIVGQAPFWIPPRILLARAYQEDGRMAAAASVYADIERLAPDSAWGPYGQAIFAAHQQRFAEARTLVERALIADAAFAPALQMASQLARRDGDHAAEERWLLRLIDADPRQPVWWRLAELAELAERTVDAANRREIAWRTAPDILRAEALARRADAAGDTMMAERWRRRAQGLKDE